MKGAFINIKEEIGRMVMIVCGSCVIFVPILKNLVDLAAIVMKNILEDLQIRTRISPTSTQPPPPTIDPCFQAPCS